MAQRHRRIVWTVQAQLALGEALEYIAQDSVDGARAVLTQALAAASGLETLSERGRVVPELGNSSVREVFVFRYRLLYEVGTVEVRILAFIHGAQDFAKWRHSE